MRILVMHKEYVFMLNNYFFYPKVNISLFACINIVQSILKSRKIDNLSRQSSNDLKLHKLSTYWNKHDILISYPGTRDDFQKMNAC